MIGVIQYSEVPLFGGVWKSKDWVVKDIKTGKEYKIPYDLREDTNKSEGKYVEYEVKLNYGYDPYDNNIPGIDYFDAAIIKKVLSKSEVREFKLNEIL